MPKPTDLLRRVLAPILGPERLRVAGRTRASYYETRGTAAPARGAVDSANDTLARLSAAVGGPVGIDLSSFTDPATGVTSVQPRVRTVDASGGLTPWLPTSEQDLLNLPTVSESVALRSRSRPTVTTTLPRDQPGAGGARPGGTTVTDFVPTDDPIVATTYTPIGSGRPQTMANGAVGDFIAQAGNIGCAAISNATARALCLAGTTVLGGAFNSGKPQSATTTASCPEGSVLDSNGRCRVTGISGTVQRVLPGGKSGYLFDPVAGAFGIPGVAPVTEMREHRVCPAGFVLGKDGVCYVRGTIPRGFRAWSPDPRPLMSAHDGKVLNQARSIEKRLKKVAGKHVRKPCSCRAPRARKK